MDINLTAAMRSNLLSLQQTSQLTQQTQARLASGLKVNSALDNPTNYFAAANLRLRASDMSDLKDGMNNAIQTIKTANDGIQGITALLNTAKGIVSQARSADTTGRAELGKQFNEVLKQIDAIVKDSDYQGLSFLTTAASGSTVTMDVSFDNRVGHSNSKLTLHGFTAAHTALGTSGVLSVSGWSATSGLNLTSNLNSAVGQLTRAVSFLQTKSANLSANLAVINARLDYTDNMSNDLKTGADKLTLADMNEESANMLALQTRQNLGVTSLSLASQANQSILRLF